MFQTAMILEAFETLCRVQHQRMKEKGFWGELEPEDRLVNGHVITRKGTPINDPNVGEKLMLMVSELAEMFEAARKNTLDQPCDKDCTIIDPKTRTPGDVLGTRRLTNEEEELADVVIRVLDWCGYRGIDLGRCILAKMEYNLSRPFRHGRTC